MNIYDSILNGINHCKISNLEIVPYLQSLKPSVKQLRRSYLTKPVYVPYHDYNIQSAYLITYLPHYYNLIYTILNSEGDDIFGNKNSINIGYLGGGPGSEVYGTIKYILNNCPLIKKVNITVFDINADTWIYSHKIVLEFLIKDLIGYERLEINWSAISFDLTNPDNIKANEEKFKSFNLLVVQNCLNEIAPSKLKDLQANIKSIFSSMTGDSFFLMADLTSGARDVIKNIAQMLVSTDKIKYVKTTLNQAYPVRVRSINPSPSLIIKQNLLTGEDGLIPRANLIYDYSLLSKQQVLEQRNQIEEVGFMSLYSPLEHNHVDSNDFVHTKTFIGIDFGESSTVISFAYINNGKLIVDCIPIIQKDEHGFESTSRIVPSVLALINDRLLIGKHAAELKPFLRRDKNCWYGFKENLVEINSLNYPNSELFQDEDFQLSNGKDALKIYFGYLKGKIEDFLMSENLSTDLAYSVSIPAGFSNDEKLVLKQCLISGGFQVEDSPLIDEPNAALLNYLFEDNIQINQTIQTQRIVIIDFGAGTVDISILEINKSFEGINSKLLAVKRNGFIGGNLLDKMILERIVSKYSILLDEEMNSALIGSCEKLKIRICGNIQVDKTVNYRLPPNAISHNNVVIQIDGQLLLNGSNNIQLSFFEFNLLVEDYWKVILKTVNSAITDSGHGINQIGKVILTGGGGRNPYIKNKVATYFGESEIVIPDNIQEHVSRGTALHSFIFNSYGKNIITPISGQPIFLDGVNKKILLFKSGEAFPTTDKEIYIDDDLIENKIIASYFGEEKHNQKWFIIPKEISVVKLIFYVSNDQEVECEILTTKSIIKAEYSTKKPNFKFINLN
jgi:molecular chaperone DnaK (HSP70)